MILNSRLPEFAGGAYHLAMTEADQPASSGSAPIIWGAVPKRNVNFTGREAVFARLRREQASKITAVLPEDPLPQALQGLGGVGKTAVAIEYAHRYRSEYDVVWWIPAEQLSLVRASLAQLASQLGFDAAAATGIEGAANAALDALRRGEPYDRWLLIFDNADQPEDFPEYIPEGPGDVLITSRNPRWGSRAETVQMNVFSRQESMEFLRKRAPLGISDADADLLSDKLGDLPLALDQAGAMLAETGMPVDEYMGLIDEQITKIMDEGKPTEYPNSVYAAWTVSVTKVKQQLPQAEELLRCCAFFGPEAIPRDVFRRTGSQAVGIQVSDLISDSILFARAIRELGRFALVTIEGRQIQVHRLVQALLRDEIAPEERDNYRHDVHLILAAAAPESPSDAGQWPRYRELLPHVTSEATSLPSCTNAKVRQFILDVMRYLYLRGDFTSCEELAGRFIEQWTKDSGPDDPAVLGAQRHHGNVLRALTRYEDSYSLNEQALSRARKALGDRDTVTLALQTSVAADQRARGNFAQARDIDADALRLSESAFGLAAPQTMRTISNLAIDHGLNSDYRSARELSQRAHQLMSEANAGVSPPEVLIAWYYMAWALRLQGDYHAARDVGEDAVDYGRDQVGVDHPATLRTATGLSIALRRITAAREEAQQLAQETYDLARKRLGDIDPDTMAAAISLINARRTNGRLDDALALARLTAANYHKVYGPEHPYNYGCMSNLALMCRVTGDAREAQRLDEIALRGLVGRLGRDHDYTLVVAVNLASDLAARGEIAEARALGQDTLNRLERLLGEADPLTLACAANLSLDLRADGDVDGADRLIEQTLGRFEATLGLSHPDAVVAADGRRLDLDFDPPPI